MPAFDKAHRKGLGQGAYRVLDGVAIPIGTHLGIVGRHGDGNEPLYPVTRYAEAPSLR